MSLFDALWRGGHLRTLDHELATRLRRLDPDTPELVQAGAALASLAVARGHAGFDLARPQLLIDDVLDWPTADAWSAALAGSQWVAQADRDASAATAPLVLDDGLLYLRRYREYERRLAARLRALAAQAPPAADVAALAALFAQLFPRARDGDHQARAAALALRRAVLLVTGGPGTGKTTTIARLLVLALASARQANAPAPRIALAAPTGRAAERMAQSLRAARDAMCEAGIDAELCAALPTSASTVHRLLGTIPDSPRFRHDAEQPLAHDIVVIDEASMVDLPLMCKLTEAVADGTRLILLGDPDQLPSVDAGDVLAGILAAAGSGEALRDDDAGALAPLLGDAHAAPAAGTRTPGADAATADTAAAAGGGFLHGHRVHLQRGYRQAEGFALAPLADAARTGDADALLDALRAPGPGVHFHENRADPLAAESREVLLAHWRALADARDPAAALARAGRLRLLTALRAGPQGAQALNERIESALAGVHHVPYFHGRLLLITRNDYRQQLFNGDVGICLDDARGDPVAWFPAGHGDTPRRFHPAALPAHASAFAMTVHKAQGSEFDSVWLQLPARDNRVLSRELVYTALTRARRELHLCADAAVLRAALARHAARVSGLAGRLAR